MLRSYSSSLFFGAVLLACAIAGALPARAWDLMDVDTIEAMSDADRFAWSRKQLDPYQQQVLESARRHNVPPRLLATIILNELADYGVKDKGQEVAFSEGSVGMAQINVKRAVDHQLVDISTREVDAAWRERYGLSLLDTLKWFVPSYASEQMRDAMELVAWKKLNTPEGAIEAAAREIDWIINQINANLDKPWTKSLLNGPIDRADPLAAIRTDAPDERDPEAIRINKERALALLIVAAYNSDDIITNGNWNPGNPFEQPPEPKLGIGIEKLEDAYKAYLRLKGALPPFYNARTHGVNAKDLFAGLLAHERLYDGGPPARKSPYRFASREGKDAMYEKLGLLAKQWDERWCTPVSSGCGLLPHQTYDSLQAQLWAVGSIQQAQIWERRLHGYHRCVMEKSSPEEVGRCIADVDAKYPWPE